MSIRIDGTNTTANPGITGSDTDTGLQFGTNEVKVVTDGSDRVTVDSAGNVGIATSSIASGGSNTTNFNVHTPSSTSVYLKLSNSGTGNTASDAFDLSADSSGNAYLINRENGNMTFWTNATERMRILSSGDLTFNGDTAAANALDDYEEGTFTPTLALATPGSSSIGYSNQTGRYVKVGKIVYFSLDIRLSSFSQGTGSGNFQVQGLPVVPVDTNNYHRANGFANLYNWNYASASNQIPTWNIIQDGAVTALDLTLHREDNTNTGITANPGSTSMIFISGTYEASS